jgi:hypothetical protein
MMMATGCPRYLVYTLRPWQVGGGKELAWRASLESPHTGEWCAFASPEGPEARLRSWWKRKARG